MATNKRDLGWTHEMTAGVLKIARAEPDNRELQERVDAALLYLQIRARPTRYRTFGKAVRARTARKREAGIAAVKPDSPTS